MITRILAASGVAALLFATPVLADDNMTTGSTSAQDDGGMVKNPGNAQQPEPGTPLKPEITSEAENAQGNVPNPGNDQKDEEAVVKLQGSANPDAQDEMGGTSANPGNEADAN